MARVLAIAIGICGVLMTALLAAIAVRALNARGEERDGPWPSEPGGSG
jgi:hypothetical protein